MAAVVGKAATDSMKGSLRSDMAIQANAFVFGDDINTDYIISGKYKFKSNDMNEMARHAMEELDADYYERVSPEGGILVAGTNFGCGSSREQAPLVLIGSNTKAVLAKSFARIFFRNAINTGLPVIECDTSRINEGDKLEVDVEKGSIKNLTSGEQLSFAPLSSVMAKLLADGGLAPHFRKHGTFALE
ncbi:MAG: 3-isopropylmalate dehydratase small subunit [Coriobacteriales bacterium]|nr:3-isopropylmalate dehydratase small subunit [Coriobacteriales bacterium]